MLQLGELCLGIAVRMFQTIEAELDTRKPACDRLGRRLRRIFAQGAAKEGEVRPERDRVEVAARPWIIAQSIVRSGSQGVSQSVNVSPCYTALFMRENG